MDLPYDITAEEFNVLIIESGEHLQVLEIGLVRLEQNHYDAELLRAIFRAAHTLKSTAGMISPRLSEITHALESLLDGLCKGTLAVTPPLVEACFDSLDALQQLYEELSSGIPLPLDVASLLNRLKEFQIVTLPASNGGTASAASAAPPAALSARTKHITVLISSESQASAARALLVVQALQTLGEVHDITPPLAIIETGKPVRKITASLVTSHPDEVLQKMIGSLPEIEKMWLEEIGEAAGTSAASPVLSAQHGFSDKTVRTSVERLDSLMNLVGELLTDRNRLNQLRTDLENAQLNHGFLDSFAQTSLHLGRIVDQLQDEVMRIRLVPISLVLNKLPRLARELAHTNGKTVEVVIHGGETELDRSVIEAISDPLVHLLRNAVDHGLETPAERRAAGKAEQGTVLITARHEENHILISIEDDGRGIDLEKLKARAVQHGVITAEDSADLKVSEALELIFHPGLSTVEVATNVSGRGMGMNIVRTNVERLNGSVVVETWAGQGTRFQITLPLTLAILSAMLVRVDNIVFAIPMHAVTETLSLSKQQVHSVLNQPTLQLRGHTLPLVKLSTALGLTSCQTDHLDYVLTVHLGKLDVGLMVEALIGEQEIVIKSLGSLLNGISGIAGASILGDGSVALVVDVPGLFDLVGVSGGR